MRAFLAGSDLPIFVRGPGPVIGMVVFGLVVAAASWVSLARSEQLKATRGESTR